jgi:hypothetical protein
MELLSLEVGCSAAGTVPACEMAASRTTLETVAAARVARCLRRELDDDAVDMITSGWVRPGLPAQQIKPRRLTALARGHECL